MRGMLIASIAWMSLSPQSAPTPGTVFELRSEREHRSTTTDGSSSSSSDKDTIIERVIDASDAGVELEFDMVPSATDQERASTWQLPVRVFRPVGGPARLVNVDELERRVDPWLKAAGWTRAICGEWIFTWNAFHIDCDPRSALAIIDRFDIGPQTLREGMAYTVPGAKGSASLVRAPDVDGEQRYSVVLTPDAEAIRRERVEADVVIAQLSGTSVTKDAALQAHAGENIDGTITATIRTDAAGSPFERTVVTQVRTTYPDGRVQTDVTTAKITRRKLQ